MGPIILAIEVVGVITAAVAAGESIAISVIQQQIRNMIKDHQQQFDALKDIQTYLKSLINQNDCKKLDKLSQKTLVQNLKQIQDFLKLSRDNLKKLIQSYPSGLAGQIIPTKDEAQKIMKTYKKGDNLQRVNFFADKTSNPKQSPSLVTGSIDAVSFLEGVDWGNIGKLLLQPGLFIGQLGLQIAGLSMRSFLQTAEFITAGAALSSVFAAIGIAFNVYSIIEDAEAIKKLVDKKDEISKQIGELPQTEIDTMNVIKGSINAFLVFIIVAGDLITRIKQKIEFIFIFSTDENMKSQIKPTFDQLPDPHTLIPIEIVKTISAYSANLQDLYKIPVNESNVKDKIVSADAIFKELFSSVDINGLHKNITVVFKQAAFPFMMANDECKNLKKIQKFFGQALVEFERSTDDKATGIFLTTTYGGLFEVDPDKLIDADKLVIVKCVAAIRQKFIADDPSGLTYLGLRLADYKNNLKYSDIEQVKFNQEDITQYSKDWVAQYLGNMQTVLKQNFPAETNFTYQKTILNFTQKGPLQKIRLQVQKLIYFKGATNQYCLSCEIQDNPQFKIQKSAIQIKMRRQRPLGEQQSKGQIKPRACQCLIM